MFLIASTLQMGVSRCQVGADETLIETSDPLSRLAAQSPMPRRLAIAFVLLLALVLGAVVAVPEASANITGPCTGSIAATDVGGLDTDPLTDPIEVTKERPVPVSMAASRPISRLKVEIEFSGLRYVVHERPTTGSTWASEVPVDDYAKYGLGTYKIVVTSEGQGFSCEGTALVSVEGDHELDPLKSVAGIVGLGLALVGALGVLAVAGRIGRGRAAPFLGLILGAILGLGIAVLLQQFSVVYPTVGVVVGLAAIGAAIGLAFSLFGLPTRSSDARNPTHH
jgi:hypothetical protein